MSCTVSIADSLSGNPIYLRRNVEFQVCHSFGQSPALVFLHGGLGNRFNWRSQYEFTQAQGWEALTYDLSGHGQSSPYRRYSIGRHCRDLDRLLQRFDIQNPILCCHSYGVPLGLEWADRYPVSALVLIAGGTHDLDPWWEVPLMKLLTWGGRHLYRLPIAQAITQRVSSFHHQRLDRFFAESPVPHEIEPYKALEIFWGYNFFARRRIHRYAAVPTLVISGGQDAMFDKSMGRELASHFQHARHLHLPKAGHLLMAEYPDLVNEAIGQWRSEAIDRSP